MVLVSYVFLLGIIVFDTCESLRLHKRASGRHAVIKHHQSRGDEDLSCCCKEVKSADDCPFLLVDDLCCKLKEDACSNHLQNFTSVFGAKIYEEYDDESCPPETPREYSNGSMQWSIGEKESSPSSTVYVVGDTHGDMDYLVKCLRATGLFLTKPLRWNPNIAAGSRVMIFILGDIIDRGCRDRDMLLLVKRLKDDPQFGHRLEFVLGNHEVLTLQGHDDYAGKGCKGEGFWSPAKRSQGRRKKTEATQDRLLMKWLSERPVLVRHHGLLLCHGGVSKEIWEAVMKTYGGQSHPNHLVSIVNDVASKYFKSLLNQAHSSQPFFLRSDKSGYSHSAGITWYRGYSAYGKKNLTGKGAGTSHACELQAEVAEMLEIDTMVVAHTSHPYVQQFCEEEGKLFAIDTHPPNYLDCSDEECDSPGRVPVLGKDLPRSFPQALKLVMEKGAVQSAVPCFVHPGRIECSPAALVLTAPEESDDDDD